MAEDRHARFRLHARDQALAAARHDEVDGAVEALEHQTDGVAISRRHHLDGVSWQARRRKATLQAATIAAEVRKLSEPPRRIAALPDFMASAPASAVTLGRLS